MKIDMLRIVMDTSSIVAAFFGGKAKTILSLWYEGKITICYSQEILNEYELILYKIPPIRNEAKQFLQDLRDGLHTEKIDPVPELMIDIEDPTDKKFIECLHAANAQYLVTQDDHLLILQSFGDGLIVKPAEFLRKLFV